MDGRSVKTMNPVISDEVLTCVMHYIDGPGDRQSISLVCRRWYEIDALTRKHVTIALCYASSPDRLMRRFRHLKSLKLKGKPRPAMFNLIPEDWGGYATPWVNEMARFYECLKSVHFRRMIVSDKDLEVLAYSRGHILEVLKLDMCSGFSTDGLSHVGRQCRNLRTLFLEESSIIERNGAWLHELALNNTVLETLNFYMTELSKFNVQDLQIIARNCPSLVSVKIGDCEFLDLLPFLHDASALEEFGGGLFNERPEKYANVAFPPRVCRLGLTYITENEIHIVYPFACRLRTLDLLYAMLSTEDHCLLIQRCPNLEVLTARNVLGDRGLEVVAQSCKRLKRLRIERGADEPGMYDEGGIVSQRGLVALSRGCRELEHLAVYVSDITNSCLECIGTYSRKLCDFRLALLNRKERIPDLPLDNGVRALLEGCAKLRRFALYLRPGGLTDVGLGYVGQYSQNVRWMLLGYVGESDTGLLEFSRGCPSLRSLEMRGCFFSEEALAGAVIRLASLRFIWVQGYRESKDGGRNLQGMIQPFWNIELIPARTTVVTNQHGEPAAHQHPAHIIAYCSLAGPRTDFPDTVIPLDRNRQR